MCEKRGEECYANSNQRSELAIGLDDATPDIAVAAADLDLTVLAGLLGVLAGDPEHTRSHADVVADLELIPGFQSNGHALIFTPAGVIRADGRNTTDRESSLQQHRVAADEAGTTGDQQRGHAGSGMMARRPFWAEREDVPRRDTPALEQLQTLRGMVDLLPEATAHWQ